MNVKTIAFAALATLAAGGAFAQEAGPEYFLPQAFESGVSRAEVVQATLQARAAGQIVDGERSHVAPALSIATRAQVLAEAAEARRLGLIAQGEVLKFPTAAQLAQIHAAGERANAAIVAGR